MDIGIIGGGSWGTALSLVACENANRVTLWVRNTKECETMVKSGINQKYLPGIKLSEKINISNNLEGSLKKKDMVIFAVPAQNFRETLSKAKKYLDSQTIIVNVAKGIEQNTLERMSEIAEEILPHINYAVLSGPSHAEEVAQYMPTTVVVASKNIFLAEKVQDALMTDRFRVYTNGDVVGVELGGALKNIIALGAGISDGVGFGDNAKAALMTRGITEMTRLGIILGAEPDTFAGLAGVGDLIVTCTSAHSRNRKCGILIGEGVPPEEAIKDVGMVVEGIYTTYAAENLAKNLNVEMPITNSIYQVLKGEIGVVEAVELLMGRDKKNEHYGR